MKIASVMTRDPKALEIAAGVLGDVNFLARKAASRKWNLFGSRRQADDDGSGIAFCYEDDELDAVERDMAERLARRLPVIDRRRRLVGIVSIDDVRNHLSH